jgi:crotonobetainyl-CoA:carnitine CoA-transferase CaiB-like acyl-CoA transferase
MASGRPNAQGQGILRSMQRGTPIALAYAATLSVVFSMQQALSQSSPRTRETPLALPVLKPAEGFQLLAGVRVLDLSTSIAGPYASMLLGDMGAEVIKIERPGTGDDARAWGPPFIGDESLWYVSVNRNKRSVTLDYTTDSARPVLVDLIKKSDVVVVNLRPRVQRKLKLDFESCKAVRPDVVHVSITGFGLEGKRSDWACYDLIAEGYSGVMDITGEADRPPQKIGTPAADMLAGCDAAFAAVSALFDRARTGRGHAVDVALVDSMTKFLTCRIVPFLASREVPRRSGGKDSVIAIYQAFETADLPITLGLGNDAIWERFWASVGRPHVAADARYNSNSKRREQRAEIVGLIQSVLRTEPRQHWLAVFGAAGVPAGPINQIDEVTRDEELLRRGLFYALDQDGCQIPQVGTGFHIDGEANIARVAPPKLGASTDDVLRDLVKLSKAEIDKLRGDGVI